MESGVRKHPELRVSGWSRLQGSAVAGTGEVFGPVWIPGASLLAPQCPPQYSLWISGPAQGA